MKIICFISLLLLALIASPTLVSAEGIGFEKYDLTTHVWNNGSIKQDYYYTGNCNSQISNIETEQWEIVKLGLTYGNTQQQLINNYVEVTGGGCNRIEETNNQTYVNITAWKSINYLGRSGILAKNSYIELNDDYMKETFYFKANQNINTELWFVMHRENIKIGNDENNDILTFLLKNKTEFIIDLSEHEYNNDITVLDGEDLMNTITISDEETNDYIIFMADHPNDNFKYVIVGREIYIMFNAGTFQAGQSKTLETYWVDGPGDRICVCQFPAPTWASVSMSSVEDPYYEGDRDNISYKVDYGPDPDMFCSNAALRLEVYDDNGYWQQIVNNPTDDYMTCVNGNCLIVGPLDNSPYIREVDANHAYENLGVRARVTCGTISWSGETSTEFYTDILELPSNATASGDDDLISIRKQSSIKKGKEQYYWLMLLAIPIFLMRKKNKHQSPSPRQ